ncbi:MAG TPA: hypothetical protein VJ882_02710 [Desulfuromonadales bacterium]|nr:hypothetical protein [Desulfuromonadales bacterium]
MGVESIVSWTLDLYHSYTVFVILFLVVMAIVTIINPGPMFRFYLFVLFMASVLYVLSYVADSLISGSESRKNLSTKSMRAID